MGRKYGHYISWKSNPGLFVTWEWIALLWNFTLWAELSIFGLACRIWGMISLMEHSSDNRKGSVARFAFVKIPSQDSPNETGKFQLGQPSVKLEPMYLPTVWRPWRYRLDLAVWMLSSELSAPHTYTPHGYMHRAYMLHFINNSVEEVRYKWTLSCKMNPDIFTLGV